MKTVIGIINWTLLEGIVILAIGLVFYCLWPLVQLGRNRLIAKADDALGMIRDLRPERLELRKAKLKAKTAKQQLLATQREFAESQHATAIAQNEAEIAQYEAEERLAEELSETARDVANGLIQARINAAQDVIDAHRDRHVDAIHGQREPRPIGPVAQFAWRYALDAAVFMLIAAVIVGALWGAGYGISQIYHANQKTHHGVFPVCKVEPEKDNQGKIVDYLITTPKSKFEINAGRFGDTYYQDGNQAHDYFVPNHQYGFGYKGGWGGDRYGLIEADDLGPSPQKCK